MIPIPKIEGRRGLAILIDASGPRWEADTAEGIRAFSEADSQSRRCSASPSEFGSPRFNNAAPCTRQCRPI